MAATSYREREVKLASEIEREVAADTDNEAKGKSGEGDGGAPRRGVARKGSLLTEAQELMGDLAKMDTEIGNAVPNTDVSPEKRGSQSPSPTNGSSKGRASLARKESVGVVLEPIGGVGVSPASAEGVGEKEPLESIAASPIQKNSLDGLGAAKGAGGSEGASTGEAEEKCGEKSSIIEGRSPIELRRSSSGGLTMSGTNLVFAPLGSVPGSRPQPHSRPGSASSPDIMHVPEGDDDSPAAVKIDAAPSGSENTDHNPKDALTRSDASMMSAVTFQETPSEQQRKTAAGRMQDTGAFFCLGSRWEVDLSLSSGPWEAILDSDWLSVLSIRAIVSLAPASPSNLIMSLPTPSHRTPPIDLRTQQRKPTHPHTSDHTFPTAHRISHIAYRVPSRERCETGALPLCT